MLFTVVSAQNVNCWSRCEFIRLRIQYGTEISFEIEYHSIKTFKGTFHSVGECLFRCSNEKGNDDFLKQSSPCIRCKFFDRP